MGTTLNERGPFDAHPTLSYQQFLADFGAGRVPRIVQWRDRLEVTRGGVLRTVIVPSGRDLSADLARARGRGAWSFSRIPDQWFGLYSPAVPILLLVIGSLILATAIARNRAAESLVRHPPPAATPID